MKKGEKMSQAQKDKISASKRGQVPWNKGKTLTEQHKRRISETKKAHARPEGNCGICDQPRVQLSNGVWACPHIWGSPMHGMDQHTFKKFDAEGNETDDGEVAARAALEKYAGCSLEQYLKDTGRSQ